LKRFAQSVRRIIFKKRKNLTVTKNLTKQANKRLLNKFLSNIVLTQNSIDNVIINFRLFELRNYMLKSNSFLKMSQEEKMAYLDKLNLSRAERIRLLKL